MVPDGKQLFIRGGRRFLVTKIPACKYTGLNDRDSKSGLACVRQVMSETKHLAPSLLISTRKGYVKTQSHAALSNNDVRFRMTCCEAVILYTDVCHLELKTSLT